MGRAPGIHHQHGGSPGSLGSLIGAALTADADAVIVAHHPFDHGTALCLGEQKPQGVLVKKV